MTSTSPHPSVMLSLTGAPLGRLHCSLRMTSTSTHPSVMLSLTGAPLGRLHCSLRSRPV
jgi:hypothetical protein